jgi:hypothetical protein
MGKPYRGRGRASNQWSAAQQAVHSSCDIWGMARKFAPMVQKTSKAVLAVFTLAGCAGSVPPIGDGLPLGIGPEADDAFDQRVHARFPLGSDADAILSELRKERFLVVSHEFSVYLNIQASQISGIKGTYAIVCL